MTNRAMQEKLKNGSALDVRQIGREDELLAGEFILDHFIDGVDYADAQTESWIWSIGQHVETGEIRASTSPKFYMHPTYKCLWLR